METRINILTLQVLSMRTSSMSIYIEPQLGQEALTMSINGLQAVKSSNSQQTWTEYWSLQIIKLSLLVIGPTLIHCSESSMDPNTLNSFLLDLATNTPFVAFLIYMYTQQRKDLKEQRDDMKLLRTDSKHEENLLRERYQKVIEDLGKERIEMRESLEKRILSLEKSIRKIFSLLEELRTVKQTVHELKIKDQVRELNDGS